MVCFFCKTNHIKIIILTTNNPIRNGCTHSYPYSRFLDNLQPARPAKKITINVVELESECSIREMDSPVTLWWDCWTPSRLAPALYVLDATILVDSIAEPEIFQSLIFESNHIKIQRDHFLAQLWIQNFVLRSEW